MKILVFTGGLGNQIFGYAFYQYLKSTLYNQNIYGVYNQTKLNEHYGLEINKWFDAELPRESKKASLLTYFLYLLKKTIGFVKYLDLDQNIIRKPDALVYWAFHLDKRYIPSGEWLKFKINEAELSEQNKQVLSAMHQSNSVFLHVRRGDYHSPQYKHIFEGTCPLDYYEKSIHYINQHVENPVFFVFSDDQAWVRDNLPLSGATYIDWNTGNNSPLDMFLMSNCKAGIIANSTFSYWGARLGVVKQLICCPKKWYSDAFQDPDLYPDNWVKF